MKEFQVRDVVSLKNNINCTVVIDFERRPKIYIPEQKNFANKCYSYIPYKPEFSNRFNVSGHYRFLVYNIQ